MQWESPRADEDHPLGYTAPMPRPVRRPEARAVTSNDKSDQLHNLLAVTDTTLARLDIEDLLFELLERIRSVLYADTGSAAARWRRAGGASGVWVGGGGPAGRPGPGRHRIRRQHRETQVPGRT